jgi:hypothetical protein
MLGVGRLCCYLYKGSMLVEFLVCLDQGTSCQPTPVSQFGIAGAQYASGHGDEVRDESYRRSKRGIKRF